MHFSLVGGSRMLALNLVDCAPLGAENLLKLELSSLLFGGEVAIS